MNNEDTSCWACGRPTGGDLDAEYGGSPLGGAASGFLCKECQSKRAVSPAHLAWFIRGGYREEVVSQRLHQASPPIHVVVGANYAVATTWLESVHGKDFMARTNDMPGHETFTVPAIVPSAST